MSLVAVSMRTSVAGLILSLHGSRPWHPGPGRRHLADTSLNTDLRLLLCHPRILWALTALLSAGDNCDNIWICDGSLCHPIVDKYDTIWPPVGCLWHPTHPGSKSDQQPSVFPSFPSPSSPNLCKHDQRPILELGRNLGGQGRNAADRLKEFFALSSLIRLVRNQPQADWLSTDHPVATSLVTNPTCANSKQKANWLFYIL